MWEQPVRNVGRLTCYIVGEGVALVMEYKDSSGWDLFVPAGLDPSIPATLEIAETILNIKGGS